MSSQLSDHGKQATETPAVAADAVLRISDPVPDGMQKVKGLEFDDFRERDMTVTELVAGMARMGFQASAVADAVRIINDMVRPSTSSRWLRTLMVS